MTYPPVQGEASQSWKSLVSLLALHEPVMQNKLDQSNEKQENWGKPLVWGDGQEEDYVMQQTWGPTPKKI